MFIKIYFDRKPLILCDFASMEILNLKAQHHLVHIQNPRQEQVINILTSIENDECDGAILEDANFEELKVTVWSKYTAIEAAGGIVQNDLNELLFIFRLEKWDLPKGKVEEGEELATCAQREIEEETGTQKLLFQNKIGETYHQYNAYGKSFLKTSHWYYFTCPSDQQNAPQTEENITVIKWLLPEKLSTVLANTYPSIEDILKTFTENYLR